MTLLTSPQSDCTAIGFASTVTFSDLADFHNKVETVACADVENDAFFHCGTKS